MKQTKEQIKIKRRIKYLENKEQEKKNAYRYRKENPWLMAYTNAKQRCNNPKNPKYKNYGAKGIKFELTIEEIKKLWFRDKAYLLTKPSIDRLDSKKNYTYENCQFIEHRINSSKRSYDYGTFR